MEDVIRASHCHFANRNVNDLGVLYQYVYSTGIPVCIFVWCTSKYIPMMYQYVYSYGVPVCIFLWCTDMYLPMLELQFKVSIKILYATYNRLLVVG